VTPNTVAPSPAVIRSGAGRFVEAEVTVTLSAGSSRHSGGVTIAGIGTIAPRSVKSELLAAAVAEAGFHIEATAAWADADQLFDDSTWQVGVVLSPWKQEIGARCESLAPSARDTGVVDTVLRSPAGTMGFNTNTWAAQTALEVVTGGRTPDRVLLVGSGASTGSVALAARRTWPASELVITARSAAPAMALADRFGGRFVPAPEIADSAADTYQVVVNTTTWGETDASEAEPFGIDLAAVFAPGVALFDLNNRIGSLPQQAMAAGCLVVSGAIMQRVTNACRAALLTYAAPA
jgi:shikimate dehydrogenase